MRYARYSLATLGLLIAIAGLALAPWVNRVHFQERVIGEVKKHGGTVWCDLDDPFEPSQKQSWLQAWLGEAYFRQVKIIELEKQSVPLELLERIASLPTVDQLSLRENKLTDAALVPIGRIKNLRVLRIGFNEITDDGLAHLADLPELVVLDLCVTKVTDDGLTQLQTLPKLCRLELYGTEVTNRGMTTLAQMPQLGELDLANTQITSAGLEPLRNLPDLSDLRLDQMRLGQGQELRINDEALPHLLAMPKLRSLSIANLPISPEAIAALTKAKPGISVRK